MSAASTGQNREAGAGARGTEFGEDEVLKGQPPSRFRKTAVLLVVLGVAATGIFLFANPQTGMPASGKKASTLPPASGKPIPAAAAAAAASASSPSPGVFPGGTAPKIAPGATVGADARAVPAIPVSGPDPAAGGVPAKSSPPAAPESPKTPLARARQTLELFLAAPDWRKRLEYSLNPGSLREPMAAHFQNHPDGPVPVEGISLFTDETVPGSTRQLFGFRVRVKDFPADIPTAVEETSEGFRVDWQSFQETYEQRLRAFFETPGTEPGKFRVVLRRRHYFGPAVPGQDSVRQCFSVESPMRDESWFVWADLKNPAYQTKIAAKGAAEWDVESFMAVELVWSGDEKTGRWVTLKDVTADNWQMR